MLVLNPCYNIIYMGLDNLESKLYSSNQETGNKTTNSSANDFSVSNASSKESGFTNINSNSIPRDWSHLNRPPLSNYSAGPDSGVGAPVAHSIRFKYFFVFAILALLGALAFAYYQFKSNSNVVSAEQIMITIDSPESVASGESFDLGYSITNNNKVKIVNTVATLQYSRGSDESGAQDINKSVESFTEVNPGETKIGNLKDIIMVGKDSEKRNIKLSLVYEVEGAAASFNKVQSKDIILSPMNVELMVSSAKEVRESEQFESKIILINNTETTLNNYRIEVLYPNSFNFVSSDPEIKEHKYWDINDFKKGESKTLSIVGLQTGAPGEQKSIRANMYWVGNTSPLLVKDNRADYIIASDPVVLNISSLFNSKVVKEASQGSEGIIKVNWQNTLDEAITNMSIVLKMDNDQKVFDSNTNPEFKSVAAGAKGEINFPVIIAGPNSISLGSEVYGVRLQTKDVGTLLGKASATLKVSTTTSQF